MMRNEMILNQKKIVREGYDYLSFAYLSDATPDDYGEYAEWVAILSRCLPQGAPVLDADYPVVQNLSSYYVYDMSEYLGWTCPETGRFGRCDEFFKDWRASWNHPFVIRAEGELAGFAGVALDQLHQDHCIQEFFILRKFRRQGVGTAAAHQLFNHFPGKWRVGYLVRNTAAAAFWQAAVQAYACGEDVECTEDDTPWGMMITLRFCTR
jgi:predicted acetyltransferase